MDQTLGNLSTITKNMRKSEDRIVDLEIASSRNEVTVQALNDFKSKAFSTLEAVKKDLA